MRIQTPAHVIGILILLVLVLSGLACQRSVNSLPKEEIASDPPANPPAALAAFTSTPTPFLPPTRPPGAPILTPTPDAPHPVPTQRRDPEQYMVQAGDTVGNIATKYGVSVQLIVQANELINPNWIDVGQILTIPVPEPTFKSPSFKIIPDSELVYGPYSAYFDTIAYINSHDGYLGAYEEELDTGWLDGAEIVQRVALEFSVNPKLLLSVLEYQSGWLRQSNPAQETLEYPIGMPDPRRAGLYRQLAYAANELNRGYYLWRVNALSNWVLVDGTIVPVSPVINAGTAGIQHLFSKLYDQKGWETALSESGVFALYQELFGYPFDFAYEPLIPTDLQQPAMQLPFESGASWAFTGGPHGGWGDGSGWAAVDFAPPGEALGCVQSDAWVVAAADGLILRSENGAVVQDLDGDGLEQTGWTLLYMHIENRKRVQPGSYLVAGERIGHPSCEGGVSTGTHVHIARRYNGEWVPVDGGLPFIMDGWVSTGTGVEYDGYFQRNGQTIEAWNGRSPENEISR